MHLKKYIVALSIIFVSFMPVMAIANSHPPASTIIPCGLNQDAGKVTTDPCDFNALVTLAKNVIDFLIFKVAAPLAALMFAYAGFLYLTNGGNEGKVKEAHEIFLYVFWGFVIALGAWLAINMLLSFFVDDTFNFLV